MSRPGHISNRSLVVTTVAAAVCAALWVFYAGSLPVDFRAPGSAWLQSAAIAGSLLLLVPVAFAVAKRSGHAQAAPLWFTAHAIAALAGTVLIVFHTAGRLDEAPALLLLGLLALMGLGIWARIGGARHMADTFGTKSPGFAPPSASLRAELREILDQKRQLLTRLDASADEARFAPTIGHWLRRPRRSHRYLGLARREAALMGQRASVGARQAWWRPLHLVLAALFVGGLVTHVVVVTFFAAWVADGREITWWHLTAW